MSKLLLFTILLFFSISACNSNDKQVSIELENIPKFSQVDNATTGINFSNDVVSDLAQNAIFYKFYNDGGGVSVGDINNDGLQDLFFTGNQVPNKLYLNKGDFQFEDITDKAFGSVPNKWSTGSCFVDINKDGFLDLYVCNGGPVNDQSSLENDFFINNGNLTFSNKAKDLGVNTSKRSVNAAFVDMDLDGDLDLIVSNVANYVDNIETWFSVNGKVSQDKLLNVSNTLFINTDGIFTDKTKEYGLFTPGYSMGINVLDVNEDSYPDLYICNDYYLPDYLMINLKGNGFYNKNKDILKTVSYSSKGCDAGDINNDGMVDIFTTGNHSNDQFYNNSHDILIPFEKGRILSSKLGFPTQVNQNSLQIAVGGGAMVESATAFGVSSTEKSWSPIIADFNNDGWKDIFVSSGNVADVDDKDFKKLIFENTDTTTHQLRENSISSLLSQVKKIDGKNHLFYNSKGKGFVEVNEKSGLISGRIATGTAIADLDNDGDLDIICNSINDGVQIFKNESTGSNYLRVKLEDSGNSTVLPGASVKIYYDGGQLQRADYKTTKGFLSCSESTLHFGLDQVNVIDSMIVSWNDRTYTKLTNIKANQYLSIDKATQSSKPISTKNEKPLFTNIGSRIEGFEVFTIDNFYNDYFNVPTLPYLLSNQGPCLAVGDIDGDGDEDFYVGGAKNVAGQIWIQEGQKFVNSTYPVFEKDKVFEDLGAEFFDADGDGDLDLYIACGGGEDISNNADLTQDKLYINDGNGALTANIIAIPEIKSSTKSIVVFDYDGDGDKDLFVAGRNVPGNYGAKAKSYLLNNENALFTDVMDEDFQSALPNMITGAKSIDIDLDGDQDLVVCGEWSEPMIFLNEMGKFSKLKNKVLESSSGWWFSIYPTDYDGDGDIDIIAGNIGENNPFNLNVGEPLKMITGQFDESKNVDVFLYKEQNGKDVLLNAFENVMTALPNLKLEYDSSNKYNEASMSNILGKTSGNGIEKFEVNTLSSFVFINDGNMNFTAKKLPKEAQLFPILDILVDDYNHDGVKDVLLAGSIEQSNPSNRHLANGKGLLLLGSKDGNLRAESNILKSGIFLDKNTKTMKNITLGARQKGILVGNNNGLIDLLLNW
ncbi:MAG: VCBS repeat-containing protein [Lewinellaceae bacterium]|nr:VCBS repeat-containing protein [Lewinellaceae bacterium]